MQDNLENTLASLVAIPSTPDESFACHSIMQFIHNELTVYDLSIQAHYETLNPWLIATTTNTQTPDILLYCHLDVVVAPSHLFQMKKRNGRLYGRGVFDMKFAAACYLEFLRNHATSLSDLNIGFLFTTDEEGDSGCMDKVIESGIRPKVVFMPDGGGDWEIEKRAKGFHAVEITTTGQTAHGSRPWEGESALHSLLDIINPLREKYPLQEKEQPTLMINSIQSGQAINQIPDSASAKLDFRSFSEDEINEYKDILAQIPVSHPNATINVQKSGEPLVFEDTSPAVQSFLDTFEKVRGAKAKYRDSYGASDSRYFAPLKIPCIIIEPRGGDRHSNGEWLEADDLLQFFELLERWILNHASTTHPTQHHATQHVTDAVEEIA